jgi:hypothetical protein
MSDERRPCDPEWPRGFDEHSLAQRRRMAQLPLSEKLRWLEEAHEIVRQLERGRDERKPGKLDESRD